MTPVATPSSPAPAVNIPTNLTTGMPVFKLSQLMAKNLNNGGLESLCLVLDISFDHLGGSEIQSRSSYLIQHMGRLGKTKVLFEALAMINGSVDWLQVLR